MKTLLLVMGILLATVAAKADVVCDIKGSNMKLGIGKAPLVGPVIYIKNSSHAIIPSTGLESYAITERPDTKIFKAEHTNYSVVANFITAHLTVVSKKPVAAPRDYTFGNCCSSKNAECRKAKGITE